MARTSYAIALGSNRRGQHGAPAATLRAAVAALRALELNVASVSAIRNTPALGPAGRGFANAVLLASSDMDPGKVLDLLQSLECDFGRRSGRRWGPRILDLDILLWSGGCFSGRGLIVPHPALRERAFVLEPLAEIAPRWRDPITGATMRQLLHRLQRPNPVDPPAARP